MSLRSWFEVSKEDRDRFISYYSNRDIKSPNLVRDANMVAEYLFNSDSSYTSIGIKYGLHKQRVRQITMKAGRIIIHPANKDILKMFDSPQGSWDRYSNIVRTIFKSNLENRLKVDLYPL